jgi:hypothetical protein
MITCRILNLVIALLCVFGAATGAAASCATSERPMLREGSRFQDLLLAGKFDELEKAGERTRDLSVRTSDGQPLRGALSLAMAKQTCGTAPSDPKVLKSMQDARQQVDVWLKAKPDSNLARLFDAMYYHDYAWTIRGSGYANTVRPEAWEVFHANVKKAASLLDALPPGAKDDPLWYTARMSVARDRGDEDTMVAKLTDEALDRFPLYLQFHFVAASRYERKWGGKPGELAAFVERSVALTQKDLGDTMYARLHWSAWTNTQFRDGQTSWPRMKRAFERIVADYPDPWNRNNYAKFACFAGDAAALSTALKSIGESVMLSAWGAMEIYSACREFATKDLTGRRAD